MNYENEIDKLFDEDNDDNLVFYDENNVKIEFEQVAVIPINSKAYALLKPLNTGICGDDEALVFCILNDELMLVEDEEEIDSVFEEYYRLLREAGVDVD